MSDYIDRQAAINEINERQRKLIYCFGFENDAVKIMDIAKSIITTIPPVQSSEPERKEVIPHKNYQYLSDYWCECGNHLGKKYEVTYCSDCGRKVNWDG